MKRALALMTATLVTAMFGFAGTGFAQNTAQPQVEISSAGAPSTDLPVAQYQAFDQFRADHPEIVGELSRNPRLLKSESFQAKNPALRDFLSSHPQMKSEMEENPGDFLPLEANAEAQVSPRHHRHYSHHHQTAKHAENTSKSDAKAEDGEAAGSGNEPGKPAGVSAATGGGSGAPEAGGSNAPSGESSTGGSSGSN
ncbi:MAG: hypothetical protein ACREQN_05165 [Candidatus Binataceae bacterium]